MVEDGQSPLHQEHTIGVLRELLSAARDDLRSERERLWRVCVEATEEQAGLRAKLATVDDVICWGVDCVHQANALAISYNAYCDQTEDRDVSVGLLRAAIREISALRPAFTLLGPEDDWVPRAQAVIDRRVAQEGLFLLQRLADEKAGRVVPSPVLPADIVDLVAAFVALPADERAIIAQLAEEERLDAVRKVPR